MLIILLHYHKCVVSDESIIDRSDDSAPLGSVSKVNAHSIVNPYIKFLENARDIEYDGVVVEGNAQNGPIVRLPFYIPIDTTSHKQPRHLVATTTSFSVIPLHVNFVTYSSRYKLSKFCHF